MRTLVFAALVFPGLASAAELHVGQGNPFPTIQSAVNAAENGDVVVVHAGTYVEQIIIDAVGLTDLSIKAHQGETVNIVGPDQFANAIIANTVNLHLKGLNIDAPEKSVPAQRGITFISETGPLSETFTLSLCDTVITGDMITGGVGIACTVGTNDTLEVYQAGTITQFRTAIGSTCNIVTPWDADDEFQSCGTW
jgi:hypothetical protein